MKPKPPSDPAALRRAAEARLNERATPRPRQTEADARRLQHELEVHQIELEMQNDELRAAQAEVETSLERYTDLYDLAPVGYFTLSGDGTIRLVNLTGARLVGTERGRLLGRRFGPLLAADHRRAFSDFLAVVFASEGPQSCELALAAADRPPLSIHLEATRTPDGQECRAVMIDITERKQAEEKLAASERHLRAIFETEPECVKLLAAHGSLLEMNPAGLRMIEADSFQQVENLCTYRLVAEEHRQLFQELTAKIFAGGSGMLEFQIVGLKGTPRWLETHASPLRDASGKITALLGITRDITERRRAAESLRESERRLSTLFNASPAAICVNTVETGRVLDVNDQFARFIGFAREELVGRTVLDLKLWADPEMRKPLMTRLQSERSVRNVEAQFQRKDGTVRDVLVSCELVQLAAEPAPVTISMFVDVTERKQAEASLRESEERFRATFEQAAVGVARLTPEGRWLEVNQRLCDIVGYPRDELLTKAFQDITHPDDLGTDLGFVRQMLAGEIQTYTLEKRYWRKDGSLVWINLTVSLVREPAGAPRYFISVVEDIHARKQAEAALRQLNTELEQRVAERTAELEEANHELNSFSHSVSHDLRAPLRAISGFGQFLGDECASALDERGRGHLRRMMEAAASMSRLIDDLLQFAHASRSKLRRQPVDLSALAQEVVRDLQQAAPERRVQFLCAPGLSASGDTRLLRVVLVNLLGNAWKYTGKTAEPRVELGRLNADGETSLFIRDNGAGFDMQYVDRLFGAFQRLHSMAEFEGTGVGLATVQRIIHRHGGKIRAEAKVNEGATFYFTLPNLKASKL